MTKTKIILKKKKQFGVAPVLSNFSVLKEDRPYLEAEKLKVPVKRGNKMVFRTQEVKYREKVMNKFIQRSFLVKLQNIESLIDFTEEVFNKFGDIIYVKLFLVRSNSLQGKNKARQARLEKRIIAIPFQTILDGKEEVINYIENLDTMSKSPESESISDFQSWEILPNVGYLFVRGNDITGKRAEYKLFRTKNISFGDCVNKTLKFLKIPSTEVTEIQEVKDYLEQNDVKIFSAEASLTKTPKFSFSDLKTMEIVTADFLEGNKKMKRNGRRVSVTKIYPDYNEKQKSVLINHYTEGKETGFHIEPIISFDCVYCQGSFWGWSDAKECYINLSLSYARDKESKKEERNKVFIEAKRQQIVKYIFFDIEAVIKISSFNPFTPYSLACLICDEDDLKNLLKDDEAGDAGKIKDKYNFQFFWGEDSVYQFLKYVEHLPKESLDKRDQYHYKLVSFNGANFDNFFLINELAQKDKFEDFSPSSVFYFNGSVLNFKFFDDIDTYDLSRHLVGSLKSCCNAFKVNACKKTELSHYEAQCKYEAETLFNDLTYKNQVQNYNEMDVASLAVLFKKYKDIIEDIQFFQYIEPYEVPDRAFGGGDFADAIKFDAYYQQKIGGQNIKFWDKKTAGSLMYEVIKKHWELKKIKIPEFTYEQARIPIFKNESLVVSKCLDFLFGFGIEIPKKVNTLADLQEAISKIRMYDGLIKFEKRMDKTKKGDEMMFLFVSVDYRKFYHDLLKFKSAGRCDLSENKPTSIIGNFFKFDAKSMYPFTMIVGDYYFPTGIIQPSEYDPGDKRMGFFYCDIDQTNLPANKKIQAEKVFDKRGKLIENCWYTDKVLKDYLIPVERIKFLEKYGCKVTKKSGFYFSEKIQNIDLFEPLVELMKIKNNEDRLKNKKSKDYNSALRETAKLLSNAVSGKVIEQLHLKTTEYIKMKDYSTKIIENKFTIIDQLDDNHLMITYDKNEEAVFKKQQRPIFYGVLIYTYAQQYLYDTLYKYNVVYADTDAGSVPYLEGKEWIKKVGKVELIPHNKRIEEIEPRYKTAKMYNSGLYGCWENENKGLGVIGGLWSKKKEYMIICDKIERSIIKTKGMTIKYNDNKEIIENSVYLTEENYELVKKMNNSELLHFYEQHKGIVNDWKHIFNELVVEGNSVKFLCGQFTRCTGNPKKTMDITQTDRFNEKANHIVYRNVIKEIRPRDGGEECRVVPNPLV